MNKLDPGCLRSLQCAETIQLEITLSLVIEVRVIIVNNSAGAAYKRQQEIF